MFYSFPSFSWKYENGPSMADKKWTDERISDNINFQLNLLIFRNVGKLKTVNTSLIIRRTDDKVSKRISGQGPSVCEILSL